MTHPDPTRRVRPHGPTRRGDSTRPANTRRGGDRRPYPTAPTTTPISPAKPSSTTTRARSRSTAQTPIPATVWTTSATAVDLDAHWPTAIVHRIVDAFSTPGASIVLLPQPALAERPRLGVVGADEVIDHTPGTDPDSELNDALGTIKRLNRTARVLRVGAQTNLNAPAARPYWADLVGDPHRTPATAPTSSQPSLCNLDAVVFDGPDAVPADTDLIITNLRPDHSRDHSRDHIGDLVTLLAARLLRVGGILAVLTHSDWSRGELIDPTGAVVASAQNADLLYLQHIVALHVPVRGGRFATDLIPDPDRSATDTHARAVHRTTVRGLPAPHRRIHSDVLVFAQPHQYEPLPVSPAEQAHASGIIQ